MRTYTLHHTLEKATLEDYLELFQRSYGANAKLTLAYLKWLYEDNPDGKAVGVDAFIGDDLAAHYVTIPRTYHVGNANMKGLLSINTATHPNHQRKGLFKKLANATYSQGSAQGYSFVVGVANAQSAGGFTRSLGFECLGQIRLTFLRRPRPPSVTEPNLAIDGEWLRWRLSNPSATYFTVHSGVGRELIGAQKGAAIFLIGNVSTEQLVDSRLRLPQRQFIGPTAFTPIFPAKGKSRLLPLRIQPSPWHVIVRSLSREVSEMRAMQFDGLAMDTF